MRDHFIAALLAMARNDRRIILITGDLGFKVFDQFRAELPDQFINVGVAEQNMTGVATGMALEGNIVCTYSIGNFPTLRCLEQIRNDAAYHDANVKVVAVGGGFSYGALGMSHHATEDIAIMRALPAVAVLCPGDLDEATAATEAMIRRPGTCYLRLDKTAARFSSCDGGPFHFGMARKLSEGTDVTIIATGGIVAEAMTARDHLVKDGFSVRVLSMHTIKPLDEQAVFHAARETGGICTLEEHGLAGGLGSAVAEALLDAGVTPRRFLRFGLPNAYSSEVGSQEHLRRCNHLDGESVARRIAELIGRKQ